MKQFSEQFHKKALKSVKLQKAERDDLREQLVAYMEYHPLPAEMKKTEKSKKNSTSNLLVAEPFTVLHISFHKIFKSSLIAGFLLLILIPIVAEKAVPGDTLYAVKVNINEEIKSTLIFDSYQKVEWETERLNRRIAEARLLASEGKLTQEAEVEVAQAVKEHTANAQREIEVLRGEDAEAATIAAIALDTTLEVQATSLKNKEDNSLDSEGSFNDEKSVSLIANAIEESRVQNDESTVDAIIPSYDKLMAKVEQNTTRIIELITSLETIVSPEELADVKRREEDINRAIAEEIEISEEDNISAREQLINVLQSTQKLIIFITEIEISETVDIETIIPVVLTDEEKEEEMVKITYDLIQKQEQIISLLAEVEDEEIIDKVKASQANIAKIIDSLATTTDKYDSFIVSSTEAHALADDSLKLLMDLNIQSDEVEKEATTTIATTTEETGVENEETTNPASSTEAVTEEETKEVGDTEVAEEEVVEKDDDEDVVIEEGDIEEVDDIGISNAI